MADIIIPRNKEGGYNLKTIDELSFHQGTYCDCRGDMGKNYPTGLETSRNCPAGLEMSRNCPAGLGRQVRKLLGVKGLGSLSNKNKKKLFFKDCLSPKNPK